MAEKITGYTSEMCQQAMMDELKELFRDMKFTEIGRASCRERV